MKNSYIIAISANILVVLWLYLMDGDDILISIIMVCFLTTFFPKILSRFVSKWTFEKLYRNWSIALLIFFIILSLFGQARRLFNNII